MWTSKQQAPPVGGSKQEPVAGMCPTEELIMAEQIRANKKIGTNCNSTGFKYSTPIHFAPKQAEYRWRHRAPRLCRRVCMWYGTVEPIAQNDADQLWGACTVHGNLVMHLLSPDWLRVRGESHSCGDPKTWSLNTLSVIKKKKKSINWFQTTKESHYIVHGVWK